MAFTLDARPAEGNIYCKPNEHLRFGYPVKNLDGTPYNEPNLVDVWVTVYAHENSTVDIEKYTFLNGTSHANGTNVIAFDLVIDLPKGKYFCTIDHRRVINAVVESNVMFSGFFDVSEIKSFGVKTAAAVIIPSFFKKLPRDILLLSSLFILFNPSFMRILYHL